MKCLPKKSGFTLTELIVALTISIMVFSAMGSLLSRCFSLWMDASANWKIAQHSRITRARILSGGFGPGSGLLSSSNTTVSAYGSWDRIRFYPIAVSGYREVYGWPSDVPQNIWLKNSVDGQLAWAQSVSYAGASSEPLVKATAFDAVLSNKVMTINYTLNFSAMGKDFEQPQTIRAYLINQ
ncbi:MAG: type II secretion system protein [Verrucomicrobia bacterium]|nr:type II secretion system protein [Verrucomicrobiota bacterium]